MGPRVVVRCSVMRVCGAVGYVRGGVPIVRQGAEERCGGVMGPHAASGAVQCSEQEGVWGYGVGEQRSGGCPARQGRGEL